MLAKQNEAGQLLLVSFCIRASRLWTPMEGLATFKTTGTSFGTACGLPYRRFSITDVGIRIFFLSKLDASHKLMESKAYTLA